MSEYKSDNKFYRLSPPSSRTMNRRFPATASTLVGIASRKLNRHFCAGASIGCAGRLMYVENQNKIVYVGSLWIFFVDTSAARVISQSTWRVKDSQNACATVFDGFGRPWFVLGCVRYFAATRI